LGSDWEGNVAQIGCGLREGLAPLVGVNGVQDVRVLGAIGVVEMSQPVDVAAATKAAVGQGVWLRPFRNLIYTMPPYISSRLDVTQICLGICAAVEACAV
jgi:adenosylmethionine-8-amino-7-oxononanoate aminotransferase